MWGVGVNLSSQKYPSYSQSYLWYKLSIIWRILRNAICFALPVVPLPMKKNHFKYNIIYVLLSLPKHSLVMLNENIWLWQYDGIKHSVKLNVKFYGLRGMIKRQIRKEYHHHNGPRCIVANESGHGVDGDGACARLLVVTWTTELPVSSAMNALHV